MKFYDREIEMDLLRQNERQSYIEAHTASIQD